MECWRTHKMEASRFFIKIGLLWKYEELEKENPAAWIADNNVTPFKVFEVLFGNNFEQIRKETKYYA